MKIENNGIITLSNSAVECKISLWGGNIISYRPKSQQHDVFWLGEKNKFDNIQAIRGGIPVCWPRFAEEELNNYFPRHGFARLSMWNLKKAIIDEQKIEAELFLIPDNKYNTKVIANLLFKITDKLECILTTINQSNDEFCFSEALHAYFNVSNKDEILIKGLSGQQYKSSLDNKIYTLNNDLQLDGEFDGAFLNHTKNIEIIDSFYKRRICIEKTGSQSTIVWNPNKDLAEMSQGQYKNFVCVEPANQDECFVKLAPKEKHIMSMIVKVDDLYI